jgi:hypothetical protein
VTHGHRANEVLDTTRNQTNVTRAATSSSSNSRFEDLYPDGWVGCRTVETAGRRWLPEKTQLDASQTTSLGKGFENELVEEAEREETRLKDEARLEAEVRLNAQEVEAMRLVEKATANANESFPIEATTKQTVIGKLFVPANASVPTEAGNFSLFSEALKRVSETAKLVEDLERKVAEAKAARQNAALPRAGNEAQGKATAGVAQSDHESRRLSAQAGLSEYTTKRKQTSGDVPHESV